MSDREKDTSRESTMLDWAFIMQKRQEFEEAERRKQELWAEADRLWAQLERLGRRPKLLRRLF